jgi:hypothetical protein
MDVEGIDPVAVYAALMSTVALGWQIWKEHQARRPQVGVKIRGRWSASGPWGVVEAAYIEATKSSKITVTTPEPHRRGSPPPTTCSPSSTRTSAPPGPRSPHPVQPHPSPA